MDIVSGTLWDSVVLDNLARRILGHATSGVSVGGGGSRIHLSDASQVNQRRASDIFNHADNLGLTCEQSSIVVGAADPVVSCADPAISGDSQLAYLITRDGAFHSQGLAPVERGSCSVTLSKPAPGAWRIVVFRLAGNHASGMQSIAVAEKT